MFFVFDGVDGAGKSTQIDLFTQWLQSCGHSVVTCKDPGSTTLGEQLRGILLGKHEISISNRAEMLLFTAARAQLVDEVIKPALQGNKTIVLDRYVISTVVYQGHAGRLPPDEIRDVNRVATQGISPDLTFLLDIPVELAMDRLGSNLDRMESRGFDYLRRVREGFRTESRHGESRVEMIDAAESIETVHHKIKQLASNYVSTKR